MSYLIQNIRLADPASGLSDKVDLLIDGGVIAALDSHIDAPGAQVIDGKDLVACAGLVDMHVHLRQPGFEHKETIASGARAAAAGGFTAIACMPNTRPVIDSPESVAYVLAEAAKVPDGARVLPYAAVTLGQKGQAVTDFGALRRAGAVALSDDGVPIQNAAVLRRAMLLAKELGMGIHSHCEDAELVQNFAVNEGPVSRQLGIPGRPAIAEELQVMRDAMLAEETGAAVHICHISTARSVDIVRQFKKKGVAITCETCPQYFTFTEDIVPEQGANARVNPPLRTQADVEAIIAGLQDGTIDAIATDHAPHSPEEKARGLTEAPSGMIGLETALAATLTALYHTNKMSLPAIIGKLTTGPAGILHLPQGGPIAPGAVADLTIFDPREEWTVDPQQFRSKARNTPFAGKRLKGRVKYTILGGEVIYRDE